MSIYGHKEMLKKRSSKAKTGVCLNVAGRDSRVEVAGEGEGAG